MKEADIVIHSVIENADGTGDVERSETRAAGSIILTEHGARLAWREVSEGGETESELTVSGDTLALGKEVHDLICDYVSQTACFTAPVLNICLNYGARQELCRAFNLMLENGEANASEEIVEKYLFASLPPLDLVIRTGGEQRLSNFMLWQASYAELYFTDRLWPDFSKEDCLDALTWFASRKRRFGKV